MDIKSIENYKIKNNIFYYTNKDNKGNTNNINNKGKDLGIINLDRLFYYDSSFIVKNIINGIGAIDITKVKKYRNGFIIGDESGKVIFMKISSKSNINIIDEIQLPGSIIDIHINKYILVSTSNHVLYMLKISCNKIFIKKEINLSARVCAIGVKKYIFAQCSNNKMYILNRKLEILKIIDEKIGYAMKSDVNLIKGNLDGTITEYKKINRKKYKNKILEEKDCLMIRNSMFLRSENKVHNKAIFALDAYKGNIVSGGDDHLVVYDNKKYIYGDIPILDIRCVSNSDCFNVFVCYRNRLLILDKNFRIKNEKTFYFIAQAFEIDEKYAYVVGNGFIRYKIKDLI
ncbi:hypothetical protein SLOPH_2501 [Spraguea lophii 42_110]|uniref:Uncharacterized protein n=1 Tax=Spraguea lophii (strain 42_110) TaxID=1358809 RepID=S7W8S2_SPRLO|nr:hypothetical protein SLOPH_2501 [Spraguea lophii 42_110]